MYGLASGFWMMIMAGTLWGVAMSIFVSTLPMYIHSLVPRTHSATALSLNGVVATILTIFGNYIGGRMIGIIGIDSYNYALAAIRGALTALFALTLLIGKYKKKKIAVDAAI
jgi:MFS family permease